MTSSFPFGVGKCLTGRDQSSASLQREIFGEVSDHQDGTTLNTSRYGVSVGAETTVVKKKQADISI